MERHRPRHFVNREGRPSGLVRCKGWSRDLRREGWSRDLGHEGRSRDIGPRTSSIVKVGPRAWSEVKVGPETLDVKVGPETTGMRHRPRHLVNREGRPRGLVRCEGWSRDQIREGRSRDLRQRFVVLHMYSLWSSYIECVWTFLSSDVKICLNFIFLRFAVAFQNL